MIRFQEKLQLHFLGVSLHLQKKVSLEKNVSSYINHFFFSRNFFISPIIFEI